MLRSRLVFIRARSVLEAGVFSEVAFKIELIEIAGESPRAVSPTAFHGVRRPAALPEHVSPRDLAFLLRPSWDDQLQFIPSRILLSFWSRDIHLRKQGIMLEEKNVGLKKIWMYERGLRTSVRPKRALVRDFET